MALIKIDGKAKFTGKTIFDGGPAFTPTSISGLQVWLDASDTSTLYDSTVGGSLVTSDGSAVARWEDKSGFGRHASQSTVNARPTLKLNQKNSRPGLRFDGNDFLRRTQQLFTTTYSMFVVCKFDNNTTRNAAIDLGVGTTGATTLVIEQNTWATTGQKYGLYSSGNSYDTNFSTSSGEKLFAVTGNATSQNNIINNTTYRINGVTGSLVGRALYGGGKYTNFTSVSGFAIGGFNSTATSSGIMISGNIYEVLVYNTALNTTQCQQVETYLNNKWALY